MLSQLSYAPWCSCLNCSTQLVIIYCTLSFVKHFFYLFLLSFQVLTTTSCSRSFTLTRQLVYNTTKCFPSQAYFSFFSVFFILFSKPDASQGGTPDFSILHGRKSDWSPVRSVLPHLPECSINPWIPHRYNGFLQY